MNLSTPDRSLPGDRTIRLAGPSLGARAHVCAFFRTPEEEYQLLLPYVKEGVDRGEKAVLTIDPRRRQEHLLRLDAAGINVASCHNSGHLELRDWTETHLCDGCFKAQRTLELFGRVKEKSKQQGFPYTRFITHMEWALEDGVSTDDLLRYEAQANCAESYDGESTDPVICTYDLTKFSGDVVVDIMRTHPMILIGGMLQENPFYVPPDEFLRELDRRRSVKN